MLEGGGRANDGGGGEKDSGVELTDGGGSARGGGGGWSSKEICNPSVETVSAGGWGGCHRFRGVGVTACFAWWRVFSVPAAFRGCLFGTHGLFVYVGAGCFGGGWLD